MRLSFNKRFEPYARFLLYHLSRSHLHGTCFVTGTAFWRNVNRFLVAVQPVFNPRSTLVIVPLSIDSSNESSRFALPHSIHCIFNMWVTLLLFPLYIVELTICRLIDLFGCPFRARHSDGCNRLVFISGCDSGIGHLVARYAYELGFTVFAAVLDIQSDGASCLKGDQFDSARMHVIPLNVCDQVSCDSAVKAVSVFLRKRPEVRFHALLNNAGVCIVAELDWLTEKQVDDQIAINYRGVIRLTRSFAQLLIENKARLLNIGSINGRFALPGTINSLRCVRFLLMAYNLFISISSGRLLRHQIRCERPERFVTRRTSSIRSSSERPESRRLRQIDSNHESSARAHARDETTVEIVANEALR
jgi:NADP-dependent 3-hydroxy acid dehydrogenase YdfG